MRKFVILLLSSVSIFSEVAVAACPGPYVRGLGGINYVDVSGSADIEWEAEKGYLVGACAGYKFDWALRSEAELTYRNNALHSINFQCGTCYTKIPISGSIEKWACMGNMFFDLPIGMISPYMGVGVGCRYEKGACSSITDDGSELESMSYQAHGFAYQGIVGLTCQFFEKTDMRIDYRHLNGASKCVNDNSVALAVTHMF